jgi:hypothetical protein
LKAKKKTIAKKKTSSYEKKDAAMDKKQGIKENSPRDLNMDSRGMQNLKSAMMGMKGGKR